MVCYGIFWSGQLVDRLPRGKLTALGEKTVNQTVFTKERIDIRYALAELATDKRFVACVQTSPVSFVARNKGNRRRLHAGKRFANRFNRCNEDSRKYSLPKRTWRLVLSMERIPSKLGQDWWNETLTRGMNLKNLSRFVIATMLVTVNKRSLISSLCLSTNICSFHHRYLCLPRLHENHLLYYSFGGDLRSVVYLSLLQQKMSRYSLRVFWSLGPLRACLHGGGGPQVGEITCGGSPHLSCKRDHIKMRDYMDRQVTRPKRVTSPTLGPPPSCKQALVRDVCKNGCQLAQWKQWSFSTYAVIVCVCTVVIK